MKLAIGRITSTFDSALKLTLSPYRNNVNYTKYLWFETINHV